ncbi:hypothetical protein GGD83_004666 [Rhodoblastus sphagnicola]|nr:hypothetical protein [Rhodoblastus sphagnicola]
MRQKSGPARVVSDAKPAAEKVLKDIRRATRRHFSVEEKIRVVLEGGRKQSALPQNRQAGLRRLNHRPPPFDSHRPEALAKKSRLTTSWPILA